MIILTEGGGERRDRFKAAIWKKFHKKHNNECTQQWIYFPNCTMSFCCIDKRYTEKASNHFSNQNFLSVALKKIYAPTDVYT